jgi:hypothetical protein
MYHQQPGYHSPHLGFDDGGFGHCQQQQSQYSSASPMMLSKLNYHQASNPPLSKPANKTLAMLGGGTSNNCGGLTSPGERQKTAELLNGVIAARAAARNGGGGDPSSLYELRAMVQQQGERVHGGQVTDYRYGDLIL